MLDQPKVHRRSNRKRTTMDVRRVEMANQAIGRLSPGMEVFGLTMGTFSLIELLDTLLRQTGPADVIVATWTAADADTRHAHVLLQSGNICSLRFLVDLSFQSRQPEFCNALRVRFGDDAIRIVRTHAKFMLIQNDEWDLAIRTSMNLNQNPRIEDFEISDDAGLARFLRSYVDAEFNRLDPNDNFNSTPAQHKRRFEQQTATAVDSRRLLLP